MARKQSQDAERSISRSFLVGAGVLLRELLKADPAALGTDPFALFVEGTLFLFHLNLAATADHGSDVKSDAGNR